MLICTSSFIPSEGELERFGEVSSLVEEKGFYLVLNLLESKSFCQSFGLLKPMASGKASEDCPTDNAPSNRATGVSPAIPEMNCVEVAPPKITY